MARTKSPAFGSAWTVTNRLDQADGDQLIEQGTRVPLAGVFTSELLLFEVV